ncbi:acylphosphatase-2 isoform X1 [Teleopsis dalmanni]|uniref:acylphosphatase-2 isoform X1 n=1 Tax=Teleopsis dalmanni TaxID=139649 RepID=UPI0018CF5920|nr:acylphosphatase-2 isoform X1 [Teleopsis dalmanni]
MSKILSCDFEVFGIVQGVSFRMYTERQAKSLGIRGWIMNTSYDTVKGQIEGTEAVFAEMKTWLETTGSPTSRIDRAEFSVVKETNAYNFDNFTIRH